MRWRHSRRLGREGYTRQCRRVLSPAWRSAFETTEQTYRLSALTGSVCTGVAWHHAGLARDEKELVERAYLGGGVRVLCCTSTLAAGVNLPARRVLFNEPVKFAGNRRVLIDSTSYRQMAGRAGRKGLDEVGESILVFAPSLPHLPCRSCSSSRGIVCFLPVTMNAHRYAPRDPKRRSWPQNVCAAFSRSHLGCYVVDFRTSTTTVSLPRGRAAYMRHRPSLSRAGDG